MVQSLNVSGVVNAFRVIWNPSLAMPHIIVNDIRCINYSNLKQVGNIKAIGFDKDNCLTAPYVSTIYSPFKEAWNDCKATFFKENVVIVSNSAGTEDDVGYKEAQKLEESLGVTVLRHKEKKPAGGHFLESVPAKETAFVGDRIFTDVMFGNRNGNLTIWTSKVVTEKGDNKVALVLRRMEYHLIRFLQKMNVQPPPHPSISRDGSDIFIHKRQ
ncbi:mitochondrial PGP phosphatase-domain-containing protein [Thamnidium elegans]|nr:mitochondrial PGP phosphatase-domain-containing protein [Thamnidium elegans]